jgi:hypothetical protein
MIVLGRAKVKAGTGHFDGAVRRGGAGKGAGKRAANRAADQAANQAANQTVNRTVNQAANQVVNQTGAAAQQIAATCRNDCAAAPRWRRNASSVV